MTQQPATIGILGCGHMGQALLQGLLRLGQHDVHVLDHRVGTPDFIEYDAVQHHRPDQMTAFLQAIDWLLLVVRPGQHHDLMPTLVAAQAEGVAMPVCISCMAGVTSAQLTKASGMVWWRMMPNLPVALGQGTLAMYAPEGVVQSARTSLAAVLHDLGRVFWVTQESQLHIVTAVAGSGPALIWRHLQAMMDAAVQQGMPEDQARTMVLQTAAGAAAMGLDQAGDLEAWCQQVASPGGTTAEGLKVLDAGQHSHITQQAVLAACKRSEALERQVS